MLLARGAFGGGRLPEQRVVSLWSSGIWDVWLGTSSSVQAFPPPAAPLLRPWGRG